MSGQGNYSNFPDQGARMLSHQQQQRPERGNQPHSFAHQDEAPRGSQQGQMWGAPHSQYERNSRVDHPPVESSSHLHHHHSHHPQQPHFPLHSHKPENSRDRVVDASAKKTDSPTIHQPSPSSGSSSSSSARDDANVKVAMHHHHQRENEAGTGQSHGERGSGGGVNNSSHVKQEKISFITASPPPNQHGSHTPPQQQQHPHSKPNQRGGREHKTETHWGPRPGNSNSSGGSSHGRRANNNAVGGSNSFGGEDSSNVSDHKPSNQTVGSNTNKRAGPIKKPASKEMKKDGGEVDGGEKTNAGIGKGKEQDAGNHNSVKLDVSSSSQNTSAPPKDDSAPTAKPRNGGKERFGAGGVGRGPKDGDVQSGFSGSSSRREMDRSFERGRSTTHHHGVPAKGSRASRGRGGEFFGRGRGYRGTYTSTAGPSGGGRARMGGRSGRDFRSTVAGGHQNESRGEGGVGKHGQDRSQHNPARARNRSETRSEGSEYEEIPKRRRERGSETGSDSGGSDLGHSDKDDIQKPNTKNGADHAIAAGNMSHAAPQRGSQARVFTPRGVPSRRGRGGGSAGGNIYRGSCNVGGTPGAHRVASSSASHSGPSKSSASGRKQQSPPQNSGPKDMGKGANEGEKKDKIADVSQAQSQAPKPPQPSLPATTPATLGSAENGGVVTQHGGPTNHTSTSGGPNVLQLSAPRGFERPRRRRHGRSQHQQDKPPRFRRLKERENAARINGGVGVIGGGRPSSPSVNTVQDSNGTPLTATMTGNTQNANKNNTVASNSNSGGGHISNSNSHHHHHYNNQGIATQSHPQHHHSHGAKSPDFTNQNSDQANEEWETASESSDFTEFRDREGGGGGGGGKSYSSHHPHHPGRGGGGSGSMVDREMTGKEPSANKRSFSSQRPGMERQNRRVNPGGGRGPRGPAGSGSGGPGNGGSNRGEKRVNMPSPKNRK